MVFWMAAGGMGLAVLALLVLALLRGQAGAEPAAAADLRVYRDQLREVERDLARGQIGEAEAKAARAEIGRRLIAAADEAREAPVVARAWRKAALALGVIGQPDARDMTAMTAPPPRSRRGPSRDARGRRRRRCGRTPCSGECR